MGCTASKSLEMQARREGWSPPLSRSFVRSMSMPLRSHKLIQRGSAPVEAPPGPDALHVVALTSSTYGALRIPHEDDRVEPGDKKPVEPEAPGKEVVEADVKPENLPSVPEAEVIDLGELMRDLNEDESKSQVLVKPRRVRGLSRSISSVDSMRELDVKIRTVALALPNFEKKLRALDALCSISRSEEPSSDQSRAVSKFLLTDRGAESSPDRKSRPRKTLQATKSMKGLFYGETLPLPKPSTAPSSASNSSSSAESDCSGPSSSWDSDSPEALFDPEILKTFRTEIDVSPTSPQGADHSETSTSSDSPPAVHNTNSASKKLAKKMMSSKVAAIEVEEQKLKSPRQGSAGLLDGFLEVCPPKGENRAVLYVTSLRGIRKTFEDCNCVRMILQGFGIAIDERDVSMHSEFKHEMAELLSQVSSRNSDVKPVVPVPRLFIRGRYVGGVEEVAQLNEDGVIEKVVEGLPRRNASEVCEGCGGMRFVPCFECRGSCKKVVFGGKMNYSGSGMVVRCTDCNENGLIRCPVCL